MENNWKEKFLNWYKNYWWWWYQPNNMWWYEDWMWWMWWTWSNWWIWIPSFWLKWSLIWFVIDLFSSNQQWDERDTTDKILYWLSLLIILLLIIYIWAVFTVQVNSVLVYYVPDALRISLKMLWLTYVIVWIVVLIFITIWMKNLFISKIINDYYNKEKSAMVTLSVAFLLALGIFVLFSLLSSLIVRFIVNFIV